MKWYIDILRNMFINKNSFSTININEINNLIFSLTETFTNQIINSTLPINTGFQILWHVKRRLAKIPDDQCFTLESIKAIIIASKLNITRHERNDSTWIERFHIFFIDDAFFHQLYQDEIARTIEEYSALQQIGKARISTTHFQIKLQELKELYIQKNVLEFEKKIQIDQKINLDLKIAKLTQEILLLLDKKNATFCKSLENDLKKLNEIDNAIKAIQSNSLAFLPSNFKVIENKAIRMVATKKVITDYLLLIQDEHCKILDYDIYFPSITESIEILCEYSSPGSTHNNIKQLRNELIHFNNAVTLGFLFALLECDINEIFKYREMYSIYTSIAYLVDTLQTTEELRNLKIILKNKVDISDIDELSFIYFVDLIKKRKMELTNISIMQYSDSVDHPLSQNPFWLRRVFDVENLLNENNANTYTTTRRP